MRWHLFPLFPALLVVSLGGCSSTTTKQSCDELSVKPCFGVNECVGEQRCVEGEWASCVCDIGGEGGTAGDGATSSNGGAHEGGSSATGGVNAGGSSATGGVNAGGSSGAGGAGADTSPITFDLDDAGMMLEGGAPGGTSTELIASAGMNESGVIELKVPFISTDSAMFTLLLEPPRNLQGRTIRVLLRVVEGGDAGFRISVKSGTSYADGSMDGVSQASGWVYRTLDVDEPLYVADPLTYDPGAISDISFEIGAYQAGPVRIQIDEVSFH